MKHALTFMLLLTIALAAGCSSHKAAVKVKKPSAQVIGARLTEQTPQGSRVEVTVALNNPNAVPLPLMQCEYHVQVAGGGSFQFKDTPDATLPRDGVQKLTLPAAVASDRNLAGASYTVSGWVSYEPPGEIRKLLTESGIPLPRVEFAGSGKLE